MKLTQISKNYFLWWSRWIVERRLKVSNTRIM